MVGGVLVRSSAIFVDSPDRIPQLTPGNTCCFSGHRPDKLPQDSRRLGYLADMTADVAGMLWYRGVDTFITGMARGFDLIAAERIVFDSFFGDKVRLVCAMPYADHRREMRTRYEEQLYRRLFERADMIVCLGDRYSKNCYKLRNTFMVNNSAYLIAYLKDDDALHSGTGMTWRLAKNAGHTIYTINESDLR